MQFLHLRTPFIDFLIPCLRSESTLLRAAHRIHSIVPTASTTAELILAHRKSAGSIPMACGFSAAPARGLFVAFFLVTAVAAAEDDEFAFNIFSDVAP